MVDTEIYAQRKFSVQADFCRPPPTTFMNRTLTFAIIIALFLCSSGVQAQPQPFQLKLVFTASRLAGQQRSVLAPGDEPQLWETALAAGRSANRCLDLDGDGTPELRDSLRSCPHVAREQNLRAILCAEAITKRGIFEFAAGVEPFTVTVPIREYGTNTVEFWAVDGLGNIGESRVVTVTLDFVAPRLFFDFLTPPSGIDPARRAWWNADVHADVTAKDDFTPAQEIRFLEGGPAVVFSGEGMNQTVRVAVVDNLGNVRQLLTSERHANGRVVNIDKTAPVTTPSPLPGPQFEPFTLRLAAADALSGVREIRYAINGGVEAVFEAGIRSRRPARQP